MKKVTTLFAVFVFLTIFFTSCSSKKNNSNSSSSTESTTSSWTCKNCGGHSYHNHETVPDMKVCNSCKNEPDDINIANLKSPCEFANAYISIVNELYKLKWESDPSFENSMKFEALSKKNYELMETAEKLKIEISQCENYKEARKARKKDNHFKLNEWWNSSDKPEEIKKYQTKAAIEYKDWDIKN